MQHPQCSPSLRADQPARFLLTKPGFPHERELVLPPALRGRSDGRKDSGNLRLSNQVHETIPARLLTALYEEQHHIYVLLENLPLDYFAVERTYDRLLYWNNRNGSHEVDGWLYPRERYTLKEFLAKKRTFHRIDEFELVALGTSFTNSKAELPSQKLLKQLYMKFLQEQCERHLRLNTPIRLTPEIINRYGLTKWDAGKIRPYINRFNRKAKTKIRAEFDKLAALDFIREELEKSGTK